MRLFLFLCLAMLWGCEDPEPIAGDPCNDLSDCVQADRLVCLNNACSRVQCERTAQCPPDTACVFGFCDAPGCASDDDCSAGYCFEGNCRTDICRTSGDCNVDQICKGDPPQCQAPPALCRDNTDCIESRRCLLPAGECTTKCQFSTDCPSGRYCDVNGLCRPHCTSAVECPEEQVCFDGECQRACEGPNTCLPETPYRVPGVCACVACLVDVDCIGDAQGCLPSGSCTYCPRRDTRDGCERSGLVYRDGCCTECIDAVDCQGEGLTCDEGRCVAEDPRECSGDEDCTSGRICDNGACELGGSFEACSLQSECPVGEACYVEGRCRQESETCGECVDGSRCVADTGDSSGACRGCQTACDTAGCDIGERCVIPDGSPEGWCIQDIFSGCP